MKSYLPKFMRTISADSADEAVPAIDLAGLAQLALGLVVAGIVTAVGLKVVTDVGATFTAGSAEKNATDDVLTGGANLADNFSIIGTIAGLSVVIALLVGAFGLFRGR